MATKAPSMPVSSTSMAATNSRCRLDIAPPAPRMATGVRKVVSSTRKRLMPSTAMW